MSETDKTAEKVADPFSSALDSILSDPGMMSMISSMAERLKNGGTDTVSSLPAKEAAAEPQPEAAPAFSAGALAPLLASLTGNAGAGDDRRACLLRALKPYLSTGRCEAIDQIIKISRLSGILRQLS